MPTLTEQVEDGYVTWGDPPEHGPELASPVSLAHHLDTGYNVRAHLDVIGAEMAALEAGVFDRLMVNCPPQVGKSRSAVEWGAFWWLCKHPTASIVVGCYGDDLAIKRGKAIRRLVELHGGKYALTIERGSAAMKDWSLTSGGGVRSVGVGSGITGHPADLILIDDPTRSRQDADSQIKRDTVHDWYSADLLSRQQPGTKVVLIQTPWHPDDLRARVIQEEGDRAKGGRWRVAIMAALAESPDDPLDRSPGEPLPHPKIDVGDTAALMAYWEGFRSSVSVRDWRALWQCDPKAPEGALVSWQLLRERRCYEPGRGGCSTAQRTAVAVDPSGGGRDTAGVIGGFLGVDGRLHFTHDRSGVMPSDQWARAASEMAAETDADCFVVEKNYGGDMAKLVIRTAWDALRREQPDRFGALVPRIVEVTARRGKMLRAEPIGQQWQEGRCVTATYLPDLESEWATFQPGSTDSPGRLDASVHLAYELLPIPSSGVASMVGAQILSDTDLLGWRTR